MSITLPLALLALAMIALVFVASIASRAVPHLTIRPAGGRDERVMRRLHQGIVTHIALTLASGSAVVVGIQSGWIAMGVFFGLIAGARVVGDRIGRRRPPAARILGLLLAPVDGFALLIGWILTPWIGRGPRVERAEAEPSAAEEAREQVLDLTQKTVERVMVPRSEIAWIPAQATLPEILETVGRLPHTRYPVFEGDIETLIGMLDLVDLISPGSPTARAGDLARPAVVVPETVACDDLMLRMRNEGFDAAIVIDEFGGMAGLVTLQDILELIVGELVSEHETVMVRIQKLDDESYQVDGTVRIDDLEDQLEITFPEGEYETIAGLYLSRAARIPEPGEWLEVDGIRLEVLGADDRRIRTLRLVLPGSSAMENGRKRTPAAFVESEGRHDQ